MFLDMLTLNVPVFTFRLRWPQWSITIGQLITMGVYSTHSAPLERAYVAGHASIGSMAYCMMLRTTSSVDKLTPV